MKEKRTGKKDRKLLWGTIIISMILSLMVFYVLYNANNKYMTREEKAIHGILYADGSYDSLPVYYLSREWEYYPDVLLTPGDDLEKYYFRYLSIGEYGGMELDDRNGNPYGSGTYRLRIMLPSEEHTYGLYLPEIFSAYNLYVDGKLIEQVGNPDPDHYEERIQHRMFTFKGHTSVEIMIAVTDKDSASPGIQYVPAFGNPLKVNTVRGIPVFLNSSVFTLVLLVLIFSVWAFFRTRSRANALFAGVCVCVLGYTCYPLCIPIWLCGYSPGSVWKCCFIISHFRPCCFWSMRSQAGNTNGCGGWLALLLRLALVPQLPGFLQEEWKRQHCSTGCRLLQRF